MARSDVEKCFNCGNCTAICPLSSNGETFPRRIIRYAQLGMKKPLLESKELWLCYACGECTQTCPRQADPGEFMAAARRYAIASYDPLGLAKILFTFPVLSVLLLVLLAGLIALVVYTSHGIMPVDTLRLFDFIPAGVVHNLGVGALVIIALTGLAGAVNMFLQVRQGNTLLTTPGVHLNWLGALWETIAVEVLAQRRYRQDCKTAAERRPWFLQKWFVHASTLWGFLGLFRCNHPGLWTGAARPQTHRDLGAIVVSGAPAGNAGGSVPGLWHLTGNLQPPAQSRRDHFPFVRLGLGVPGLPVADRHERLRPRDRRLPAASGHLGLLDAAGPHHRGRGIAPAAALYEICACHVSDAGHLYPLLEAFAGDTKS